MLSDGPDSCGRMLASLIGRLDNQNQNYSHEQLFKSLFPSFSPFHATDLVYHCLVIHRAPCAHKHIFIGLWAWGQASSLGFLLSEVFEQGPLSSAASPSGLITWCRSPLLGVRRGGSHSWTGE